MTKLIIKVIVILNFQYHDIISVIINMLYMKGYRNGKIKKKRY